jgi:Fur family ferric uptake transcriptional regulator
MNLLNTLKKNGYRITESRKLICELLESNIHFHFNVKQLHQKINSLPKSKSNIDRTTIYRTLVALEELGLLQHSHIPHKPAIYFLNDNNQNVHLICENCDKIVDIKNHSVNSINLILQNDTNFHTINNNFVYVGKCSECI